MNAWWNDRSQREQRMLMGLGALTALLLVFQLGVKPLTDWRARSEQRAEQARDGYEMVALAAAQGAAAVSAPQSQAPLRQALTASASAIGIDLVRIGAEANGQIEVQPEDVDGERLFQWLANLQSQYGVTVAFADIRRGDGGLVKAQVLVFERN